MKYEIFDFFYKTGFFLFYIIKLNQQNHIFILFQEFSNFKKFIDAFKENWRNSKNH